MTEVIASPTFQVTIADIATVPDEWNPKASDNLVKLDIGDTPIGLAMLSLRRHLGTGNDDGMLGSPKHSNGIRMNGNQVELRISRVCPGDIGYTTSLPLTTLRQAAYLLHSLVRKERDLVWEHLSLPGLSAAALSKQVNQVAAIEAEAARLAAAQKKALHEACQRGETWALQEFERLEEEAYLAQFDVNGDEGDEFLDDTWSKWYAIQTGVGKVRYRQRTTNADAYYTSGSIEAVLGEQAWTGSWSDCVDMSESWSIGRISASSRMELDLHGQEHADGADTFLRFAIPLLVTCQDTAPNHGQPMNDDD